MDITLYYRYFTRCYSTDQMEWEGELSDEDAERYAKLREERREEFEEILEELEEDEELEDNEEVYEEYTALNYEILEKAFPDWCEQMKQEFLDDADAMADVDPEDSVLNTGNLAVDGCFLDDDNILYPEDEEDDDEEGRVKVYLTYTGSFGDGDSGDPIDWEDSLTAKEYRKLCSYRKRHDISEEDTCYEDLEAALPRWAERVYGEIVEQETDTFKENEDPADWDVEDRTDDPDWNMSEICTFYIELERIEGED